MARRSPWNPLPPEHGASFFAAAAVVVGLGTSWPFGPGAVTAAGLGVLGVLAGTPLRTLLRTGPRGPEGRAAVILLVAFGVAGTVLAAHLVLAGRHLALLCLGISGGVAILALPLLAGRTRRVGELLAGLALAGLLPAVRAGASGSLGAPDLGLYLLVAVYAITRLEAVRAALRRRPAPGVSWVLAGVAGLVVGLAWLPPAALAAVVPGLVPAGGEDGSPASCGRREAWLITLFIGITLIACHLPGE